MRKNSGLADEEKCEEKYEENYEEKYDEKYGEKYEEKIREKNRGLADNAECLMMSSSSD